MPTLGSARPDFSVSTPMSGPTVRRIGTDDLRWALAEGWLDFREKRGDLIFVGLLYPLIGLLTAAIALNSRLLPLFFPLAAGLSILGPAVATGFYELARRREAGEDAGWQHFLDPLRGPNRGALILLTIGLGILFLGWIASAWAIYQATLGRLDPAGPGGFLRDLFQTREGWTMILVGNLVGALFAVATLVLSLVSFPLVIDKRIDAPTAVATSLRAVRANPVATVQWGFRIALLLVIGSIPAFIGLAVVLPVLGYATWHLYTRLVER